MKKSDLYREYARVIDMCEGTNIKPIMCVLIRGELLYTPPYHDYLGPQFSAKILIDADPNDHSFALCLVEGKPVFKGNTLYLKCDGMPLNSGEIKVTGFDPVRVKIIATRLNCGLGFFPITNLTWLSSEQQLEQQLAAGLTHD